MASINNLLPKSLNQFRILFYDDGAPIALALSAQAFTVVMPILHSPVLHDENNDWIMYSVEGYALPGEDLLDQSITAVFINDSSNEMIQALYKLSSLESFTMSVQYLGTSGDVLESYTFEESTLSYLIPPTSDYGSAAPNTTQVMLSFESIIHSIRKNP
jgi:hypothetical protein